MIWHELFPSTSSDENNNKADLFLLTYNLLFTLRTLSLLSYLSFKIPFPISLLYVCYPLRRSAFSLVHISLLFLKTRSNNIRSQHCQSIKSTSVRWFTGLFLIPKTWFTHQPERFLSQILSIWVFRSFITTRQASRILYGRYFKLFSIHRADAYPSYLRQIRSPIIS